MASEQHEKAMDYIYRGIEATAISKVEPLEVDTDEIQCQCCGKAVNLYEEAAFVMGIYDGDVIAEQQRWCKDCAVTGMQGKMGQEQ
jgi:hypothetical protein